MHNIKTIFFSSILALAIQTGMGQDPIPDNIDWEQSEIAIQSFQYTPPLQSINNEQSKKSVTVNKESLSISFRIRLPKFDNKLYEIAPLKNNLVINDSSYTICESDLRISNKKLINNCLYATCTIQPPFELGDFDITGGIDIDICKWNPLKAKHKLTDVINTTQQIGEMYIHISNKNNNNELNIYQGYREERPDHPCKITILNEKGEDIGIQTSYMPVTIDTHIGAMTRVKIINPEVNTLESIYVTIQPTEKVEKLSIPCDSTITVDGEAKTKEQKEATKTQDKVSDNT